MNTNKKVKIYSPLHEHLNTNEIQKYIYIYTLVTMMMVAFPCAIYRLRLEAYARAHFEYVLVEESVGAAHTRDIFFLK